MDDLFLLKIFSTANLHLHYFHNVVTTFAKTFPCIKARFKYTYWYISTKKLANPNKTLAKQKTKKNWQTQNLTLANKNKKKTGKPKYISRFL